MISLGMWHDLLVSSLEQVMDFWMASGVNRWTICGISFKFGIRGQDGWVRHGTDICMEKPPSYMISTPISGKKDFYISRMIKILWRRHKLKLESEHLVRTSVVPRLY